MADDRRFPILLTDGGILFGDEVNVVNHGFREVLGALQNAVLSEGQNDHQHTDHGSGGHVDFLPHFHVFRGENGEERGEKHDGENKSEPDLCFHPDRIVGRQIHHGERHDIDAG